MLNRLRPWICVLSALWLLTACAISLNDATAVPTAPVPSVAPANQASPTPKEGVTESGTTEPSWTTLGLSGRLLYSLGTLGIHELDLSTGEKKVIFATPKDAWLTAARVSPDGQQIALAYAPPPEADAVQLGYTSLYLLPGDCGTRSIGCMPEDLQLLLQRVDPHEAYFSPVWSADSHSLYTAHFTPSDSGSSSPFKYTLERVLLPDGKPEELLQDALWPNISPDGQLLTYVVSDPKDNSNYLYVARQDGSEPRVIVTPDQFLAVDAPFFTPDSRSIIFSAVGEGPAGTPSPGLSWLDRLLGVRAAAAAAEAHNVPSDWWKIGADGTGLTRLTKQYDTSLFGAFAPDGRHIAYLSASGLYVMNPDGGDVKRLLKTTGYGTIDWVN
jgi:hypothetical protein